MVKGVWLILACVLALAVCQTDKTTDENRPYKFGFNIQGYQHRKEEKDENGIINGEYGFITADGYYRITVYATDQNGSFKIISMKNIYVGFPPEDPTTTPAPERLPGQKLDLKFRNQVPAVGSPVISGPSSPIITTTQTPTSTTQLGKGKEACAGCFLPTTTTRKPPLQPSAVRTPQQPGLQNSRQQSSQREGSQQPNLIPTPPIGNKPFTQQNRILQKTGTGSSKPPSSFGAANNGVIPKGTNSKPPSSSFGAVKGQFSKPSAIGSQGQPFQGPRGGNQPNVPGNPQYSPVDINNMFSPNRPTLAPQGLSQSGPTNGATPNAHVGPDGVSKNVGRTPGTERDGLPDGVTEDDIMNLLYRFNYTVGFHGHHEDGYVGGNKKGDYFFDGRDGVERRVEYVANEFGYQPNITLIPLGENNIRTPKEDTEKEFGLKGYEFKWFRNP